MVAKPWRLQLICCGREGGVERFDTWDDADAFRQSYMSGPGVKAPGDHEPYTAGHDRAAVLTWVDPMGNRRAPGPFEPPTPPGPEPRA